MTHDDRTSSPLGRLSHELPVKMRSPADMAAMLPYLLGFYPDDSIVAVGLQGPAFRQGGVIRIDIPGDPQHWPLVAAETARLLIELSESRDRRPQAVLLYLCRDPQTGEPPVVAGLRPLADHLVQAFRALDLPVKESLCLSGGRWWSYLCPDPACCDPDGTRVHSGREPGAVLAAATFAGLAPRGSRKAIIASLTPVGPPVLEAQRLALERQTTNLLDTLREPDGLVRALDTTGGLIDEAMAEFRAGALLLDEERTARLILGLQDKLSRDRAAEYAEPDELAGAQRLWRFLARRCVPPFEEYATAPLTLLAWTSWLAGDTATSRVVLARALDLDPRYVLARLIHHSLNGGLEPDRLLTAVRAERARRQDGGPVRPLTGPVEGDGPEAGDDATRPDTRPAAGTVREGDPVQETDSHRPTRSGSEGLGHRIPGQRSGDGPGPGGAGGGPPPPPQDFPPPDSPPPDSPPPSSASAPSGPEGGSPAAPPSGPGRAETRLADRPVQARSAASGPFARPSRRGRRRHPRAIRDTPIGV